MTADLRDAPPPIVIGVDRDAGLCIWLRAGPGALNASMTMAVNHATASGLRMREGEVRRKTFLGAVITARCERFKPATGHVYVHQRARLELP